VLPAAAVRPVRAVLSPLAPLAVLLATMGILGLAEWEVQTIKGEQQAKLGRSTGGALVENVLMTGDHAVNTTGMGMFASFTYPPLPVGDDKVAALYDNFTKRDSSSTSESESGFRGGSLAGLGGLGSGEATARVFAYSDALPAYVFIPGLALLILLPIAFALYSGFATARRSGARTAGAAAGSGALTGLVWALAVVLLRSVCDIAWLVGNSLFLDTFLVATLAGAVGGLLSFNGTAEAPQVLPERMHA
jgi:hypothetical protein